MRPGAAASRVPAEAPWLEAVVACGRDAAARGEPDVARRVTAGALRRVAAVRGWPVEGLGLRLLEGIGSGDPVGLSVPIPTEALATPDVLGTVREALLDPEARRRSGAHYTSPALAERLLGWALDGWPPVVGSPSVALAVVDPAVGGGAFLLAAARWQVARGAPAGAVLAGLAGVDVDPTAVAVAEATLVTWALDAGAEVTPEGPRPALVVGDGLAAPGSPVVAGPVAARAAGADLVVGNPPFLGQLARATARDRGAAARLQERFGAAAGGYVDTAALFLLAGCDLVRPGGRVVLVQPESVLGTRDGTGVREAVAARAALVGIWVAGEPAFAAGVDVCAAVLQVHPPVADRSGTVAPMPSVSRAVGLDVRPVAPTSRPPARSWAPLLASVRGVPSVGLAGDAGCVGDLATATAGFRQHFYALAAHLVEIPDRPGAEAGDGGLVPVLTTGLVDPMALLWGLHPARIAGRRWHRPGVGLAAVTAADPAVGAWLRARLRPKVVVAPQTRVVEAAVDRAGRFLPGVPLVAVEARSDASDAGPPDAGIDPGLVPWLIAAALSAPPVTAWALHESAGTARHRDALKLSARQVLAVPLPPDRVRWQAAARALRAGHPLREVGPDLTAAYGVDPDDPVTAWWAARLPNRAPPSSSPPSSTA